jgi:hypothetical protein
VESREKEKDYMKVEGRLLRQRKEGDWGWGGEGGRRAGRQKRVIGMVNTIKVCYMYIRNTFFTS